ncbi:hypothetical protein TOT_020000641 [Theileria orientalis strain Shintoku]|uniref:Uncharacterized protein n=1 Tax=Theileria orientalis strain Shintoku TaxID=869250 RepID=J4DPA9_THEOR|nr:hypothetical protein TOT_020000641 [Theileria orientalis strain Shintoku]BAM40384.1 hypothetical protein TOT_020000641 [Theileria orientalis strain Shintoku]|eukprot:XP_009690685.1 hypothetical protein TOT_020000641 [Theileria orientalis strain Shintoku]
MRLLQYILWIQNIKEFKVWFVFFVSYCSKH